MDRNSILMEGNMRQSKLDVSMLEVKSGTKSFYVGESEENLLTGMGKNNASLSLCKSTNGKEQRVS